MITGKKCFRMFMKIILAKCLLTCYTTGEHKGRRNMKLLIKKLKCQKCGHRWIPRQENVMQCPKCKTCYFHKPKEGNDDDQLL